ncbi:hypothetical protein GA0115252_12091, partial [Streptomyces sp. DfronAA-171]
GPVASRARGRRSVASCMVMRVLLTRWGWVRYGGARPPVPPYGSGYLTPPAVSPAFQCRWSVTKAMMSGRTASSEPVTTIG